MGSDRKFSVGDEVYYINNFAGGMPYIRDAVVVSPQPGFENSKCHVRLIPAEYNSDHTSWRGEHTVLAKMLFTHEVSHTKAGAQAVLIQIVQDKIAALHEQIELLGRLI